MEPENILIVEDEKDIADLQAFNLTRAGYFTKVVHSGEEALSVLSKFIPDLIVLDLMLPGLDGLEVCRRIRNDKRFGSIPILMVTARSEDEEIVYGLDIGADDYLTKPFSPKVLLARVKAILRRTRTKEAKLNAEVISIHGIEIDLLKHKVTLHGRKIELSATEFYLLAFFSRNPGWVYSRSQIITAVKGEDYPVTERSVDVQILSLRRKLEGLEEIIETVRGIGYRMKEEEVEA
jgi:two-component system, OmpR family, alkaline phosphatase synthesis response regulator PhoP